jgi:competence protein ComEC
LAIVFVSDQSKFNNGKLSIVFCDVGQGDAIYIRAPKGSDILIDGGYDEKVLDCLTNNMPFWDKTLDAVFLSHPHADHLGGLIEVLRNYEIKYYFKQAVYQETSLEKLEKEILKEKKIKTVDVKAGSYIETKDQVKITTFWPKEGGLSKTADLDKNGYSLIQLLTYGKFKLLLTGDAEKEVIEKAEGQIGDIDVLKVGHHGSEDSVSEEILRQIDPEIAVISVGKNNKYKHPSRLTLDLLTKHHVIIKRTDQEGEIRLKTDGVSYQTID